MTGEVEQEKVVKSFRKNFWNVDIGNFQGFEMVVKRLKDGRTVCKDYLEFLRQRSLIEEQYGKALVKLAKTAASRDEISLVRPAWDSVRNHTETVGLNHVQASNQLACEVGKLSDFIETSRDRRKWSEDSVRSLQAQLKTAYRRVSETKKAYEVRCREEIQANHLFHQEVARTGSDSTGADRAHTKHIKTRQGMDQAEEQYRSSVSSLEETRDSWQKETESCLDILQELESSRLSVLRDSAWRVSNIGSAYCVADDEVYEETRQCLESCDLEEGVQQFISQHETGIERPPIVTCETLPNSSTLGMGHMTQQRQLSSTRQDKSYDSYSLGRSTPASSSGTDGHTGQALVPSQSLCDMGRSRSDLGYSPVRVSLGSGVTVLNSPRGIVNNLTPRGGNVLPPTRPKKPPRMIPYPGTSVDNNEYFTLPSEEVRRKAVVLCEYNRKGASEISLSKNSVVSVLEGHQSSEWWKVETDQGTQGFYPSNFLRNI